MADAQAGVEPFLDQIEVAIVEDQFDLDVGKAIQETGHQRRHMAAPERHGRRHSQQAANRRGFLPVNRALIVREQAARPLEQFPARFGQNQPPRRPLDQPDARAILQRRKSAGDGGRRAPEATRRARQAAALRRSPGKS